MASLGSSFWKLWTASTVSNLADGLYRVALPLMATYYTRSPFLVALVTLVAYLPWLLLSLPAGALTDRRDRRGILVGSNALRAVALTLFAIALVLDVDSYWMLCVLAVLLGVGEVFFEGTAQAALPMVVPDAQLNKANARLFAARQVGETFVGQAGGGMLFAVAVTAAVFAPAVMYGIAVVAVLMIAGNYTPRRTATGTMRQDIAEGVRYLVRNPLLRTLALISGGMNFANIAFHSVFVLYAVGEGSAMGLPAYAFGWLLTATAVGAVIGTLFTGAAERRLGRSKVLMLTTLAAVAAQAVPAATANVALVAASFIAHGALMTVWNVVGVTMRQRIIPEELMGRVSASARIVSWGSMPLGALMGGVLGEVVGLRGVFAICALISLSLLIGLRVVTEPAIIAAEEATARHRASAATRTVEP